MWEDLEVKDNFPVSAGFTLTIQQSKSIITQPPHTLHILVNEMIYNSIGFYYFSWCYNNKYLILIMGHSLR